MKGVSNVDFFQLCLFTAHVYTAAVYRKGEFPYMSCTQDSEVDCERLDIDTGDDEKDSAWPPGPYAILVSKLRCPEFELHGWRRGFVEIESDTEEEDHHDVPEEEHNKHAMLFFCVKLERNHTLANDNGTWASGNYQIYMTNGSCPLGFKESSHTIPFHHFNTNGHIPRFTITDRTRRRDADKIVFDTCVKHSPDASFDEHQNAMYSTSLREFMVDGDCQELFGELGDDSSCYMDISTSYEVISPISISSGTLPAEVNDGTELLWKQFDLMRSLSVSAISIQFEDNFKKFYINCALSDVKWNFLKGEADDCREKLVEGTSGTELIMRGGTHARFYILFFKREIPEGRYRVLLSDLANTYVCNEDLGMEDGSIQDFQITASSWLNDHRPSEARPSSIGWCPDDSDSHPWIMVDLMTVVRVESLTVWIPILEFDDHMDDMDDNSFTTEGNTTTCVSISLFYGVDLESLILFAELRLMINPEDAFYGENVVFINPLRARFIKLELQSCTSGINNCINFELHGCKLTGIPTLDCHGEAGMFEIPQEIFTYTDPFIYRRSPNFDHCSELCNRKDDCSTFMYDDLVNCVHFPHSRSSKWNVPTDTPINRWGAKLCSEGYVRLLPVIQHRSQGSSYSWLATNIEHITTDSIITSIGYPFTFGNGQVYKWLVDFPRGRFLRIAFTDFVLGNEVCQDSIRLNVRLTGGTDEETFNHLFNERIFVFDSRRHSLFITFESCIVRRKISERGFRAVVSSKDVPPCQKHSKEGWNNEITAFCSLPKMFITSSSILNFPFGSSTESWSVNLQSIHGTIQLQFEDFYVRCPYDTEQDTSRFMISGVEFCNTNKPLDVMNLHSTQFRVAFQRRFETETIHLRREGFRLLYSLKEHTFNNLIDSRPSATLVCSETFKKCYDIQSSLKSWEEARSICIRCNKIMVTIHSDEELNFVNFLLREKRHALSYSASETYIEDISYTAHVGLRRHVYPLGAIVFRWADHSNSAFQWKTGYPVNSEECVRTNFRTVENNTLESEVCHTDLALFFICESPYIPGDKGQTGAVTCNEKATIKADIAFIVERVKSPFFKKLIDFLKELIGSMNIGPSDSQIAFVTYAQAAKIVFDFDDAALFDDILYKLDSAANDTQYRSMKYVNTHLALEKAHNVIFSQLNGARSNVQRIAFLIGETFEMEENMTMEHAYKLKQLDVQLFAMRIRQQRVFDDDLFQEIVSNPSSETYLNIPDVNKLDLDLREEILRRLSSIGSTDDKCKNVAWKNWKYATKINTTFDGRACQYWNALTTKAEHHFLTFYPGTRIPHDAENFCQDHEVLECYPVGGKRLLDPCFLQLSKPNLISTEDIETTKCDNGQIILKTAVCDKLFDCKDFSDETNCTEKGIARIPSPGNGLYITASLNCFSIGQYLTINISKGTIEASPERLVRGSFFHCGSTEWISSISTCDGFIDCVDASDELNCEMINKDFIERGFSCDNDDCPMCDLETDFITEEDLREFQPCESNEFECEEGRCMPLSKRCNAKLDCPYEVDELDCDFCRDSFHCDRTRCIHNRFLCDRYRDCDDGTDELNCVFENNTLSSCHEWWEHGYHDSGDYVIDGFTVYCDFTNLQSQGKISMLIRNIDVDVDMGYLFTSPSSEDDIVFTFSSSAFQYLTDREGYTCLLEVERTCNFETMAILKSDTVEGNAELIELCECITEVFKVEKFYESKNQSLVWYSSFYCNGTEVVEIGDSSRFFDVSRDGEFHINEDILMNVLPLRITPKQIKCEYDYSTDVDWCMYQLDNENFSGYRSGIHLKNCKDFECPPDTVKCPDSFCLPIERVCNGILDCFNREDEFECNCKNTPREILILLEDSGEDSDATIALNLAEGLFTPGSSITLLYFSTHDPFEDPDNLIYIPHIALQIREEKFNHQFFPTTDCYFRSMARNLLDQIKFQTNHTKAIIFVESSLTSAAVAEMMFTNASKPDYMIYRMFQSGNSSVDAVEQRDSKYRYVKDVTPGDLVWDHIYALIYKLFPEICDGGTSVPCEGKYRCSLSRVCLPLDKVCDGTMHCALGDDELHCDFFCPYNCTCIDFSYTVICRNGNMNQNDIRSLSPRTRIADMSVNSGLENVLKDNRFRFQSMTKLNLSSCNIVEIYKEGFNFLTSLKCLDLSNNKLNILHENVFNHLKNLVYLNLDRNFNLQVITPTAFHGLSNIRHLRITHTQIKVISPFTFSRLNLLSIDISNNEITDIGDYAFNGSSIQNIDMRGNAILTFNKLVFEGVSSLEDLRTPSFKFCCVKPCTVKENKCSPPKDEFSSCADLMRHPILQSVLWIVGITALFGNVGTIVYRLVYDRARLKIGYGIFVTNLAGADLLMGVYLLIIAIVDSHYRNRYIFFDDYWRNSGWCTLAGILSTVSSEASVIFVCLITLDRLIVIKYPFGNVRFNPLKSHLCCFVSWVFSLLIAVIPVVDTSYFGGRFYSRSAVCIALPLTRDKPPGWMYSVSIFVGLNFCTFILVAIGQVTIFIELRKSRNAVTMSQKSRRMDLQVARNLILVATTDFMCWFPIGLMGIMALNGYPITGDVYAWTAVFILPFNSALNPILYTLSAIIGKKSFSPSTDEQSRKNISKETGSILLQHQLLIRSIRVKGFVAQPGQSIDTLLKSRVPLSISTRVAVLLKVSKYINLLHDTSVVISDLSIGTTYVRISSKKANRVSIVLDSKLSIAKDENQIQDNIYQFGILVRNLIGHNTSSKTGDGAPKSVYTE